MPLSRPLTLALLLGALPAAAQAPPDRAAVLARFTMGYPFPSPDGAHVASQAGFDGRWQLYTLALDSGRTARLSVSDANDTHPAYAPDGR
ncbi:MAG: hypothetical protein R3181_11335, partial [Rubricoccaceae bacterium]|nr:hypothetical protein [Rubricoccaceae bacterium]